MRRLHTRIYLHLLGVLVVGIVAAAALSAAGWRGDFRRRMVERTTELAAAQLAIRLGDPVARDAFVRELARELRVDITVRGLDGAVLSRAGRQLPELSAEDRRAAHDEAVVRFIDDRPLVLAPVRQGEGQELLAYLQASHHRPPPGPKVVRTLVWIAVVLVIVALVARPLSRRISRPIEQLIAATRRFGGGDLHARVALEGHRHGKDELDELTAAWNAMAERISRLVQGQRELLANVSHELRSPLTRIRLALELLPDEAKGAARLRDVERDLDDLERLIDTVLTTSRLDTVGLPVSPSALDAQALVHDVAEAAKADYPDLAVTVVAEATELHGDAALLRRALKNLVDNAAKYGASPVELGVVRKGDEVVLFVSDAGPGIPQSEREQVQGPFARGGATRGQSGYGLGLTLVRSIARAHGGSLSLDWTDAAAQRGLRAELHLRAQ
jgi:signal transduction histidine kinase